MANKTKPQAANAESPMPEVSRDAFQPGQMVRLPSGREAQLLRRAKDAVPTGWIVEGEISVVAEAALRPLDASPQA